MPWDFSAEMRRWGPAAGDAKVSLAMARAYCAHVARSHYENFSVVSLFLPRRLIRHFHAIYSYCRWSDDLADETAGGKESLELLAWWRSELLDCFAGRTRHPVMIALHETIRRFDIPAEPFLALLDAFEQDQRVKEYETFEQLLRYCRNSANPVGQLVLYLFECNNSSTTALSNEICTGLQLANFWQDVSRDLSIGRIYLPREERLRFRYSDVEMKARVFTPQFAAMMRFQVDRARDYFERGKKLIPLLPRHARIDIDLFIRGGLAILRAIEKQNYDLWQHRPEVSKRQKVMLLLQAVGSQW